LSLDHDQEWKRLGKPSISDQTSPNSILREKRVNATGEWLFRHRTALPLPLAVAILATPRNLTRGGTATILAGVGLTVAGELLRLWGVRQIGVISRTRSDRLGPLVTTGPFGYVRNPLYLGNIALWTGFALAAREIWLAPVIVVLLGLSYHAIVRWEEGLLEQRLGDAYRQYAAVVPRWLPRARPSTGSGRAMNHEPLMVSVSKHERFSWKETLFSERGTLLAMGAGYLLLWLKARF
jgi:protein-S-isoprenylcysteine O-methyltransferase Ste14